jgi:hypothetical protein
MYSSTGVTISGSVSVYYEVQLDLGESWNGNYMEVEHVKKPGTK